MKEIYLVRHGETEYNRLGIVQGRGVNSSLNTRGQGQAQAFYKAYGHIAFDAIYTSTLRRSIESVAAFIESGAPHYALPGLDEIDWGNREGQEMTQERMQYYRAITWQWSHGDVAACIEGGESPVQVAERQGIVIDAILANSTLKRVLLCMHGRAIRILLCRLLRYPLFRMDAFAHSNMGLYLLQHTGAMCAIEKFNDTRHLSDKPIGR